jgi:hypothetical protein
LEEVNRYRPTAKSPSGRWELVDLNKIGVPIQEFRYAIRPAGDSGPGREFRFASSVQFFWSPDGRELVGTEFGSETWPWDRVHNRHWRIDPATGKRTPLPLPAHHVLSGYTADPDRFVTLAHEGRRWNRSYRLCIVSRDGKTVEPLTEPNPKSTPLTGASANTPVPANPGERFGAWVARDGREALVLNRVADKGITRLAVLDLSTRQMKPVPLPLGWSTAAGVGGAAWSPDGSRIAVASQVGKKTAEGELCMTSQLTIIDARTGSARVIYHTSRPFRTVEDGFFGLIDWR